MTALEPFHFNGQQLRVIQVDGEPWFVAADVARILGYRDAYNITRRLDPDERGTRTTSTPSGEQEMTVISEPGLYAAILGSQVEGARSFKRWLKHDVLPSIRRTGNYGTAVAPPTRLELAQMVIDAETALAEQRALVSEMEPKAQLADTLMSAEGDWSVREAAQVLSRDPNIAIGQNRLFAALRDLGWIDRKGTPLQSYIDDGRLSARTQVYLHPHTQEPTMGRPQVRITGRGVAALHQVLAGPGQLTLDVEAA